MNHDFTISHEVRRGRRGGPRTETREGVDHVFAANGRSVIHSVGEGAKRIEANARRWLDDSNARRSRSIVAVTCRWKRLVISSAVARVVRASSPSRSTRAVVFAVQRVDDGHLERRRRTTRWNERTNDGARTSRPKTGPRAVDRARRTARARRRMRRRDDARCPRTADQRARAYASETPLTFLLRFRRAFRRRRRYAARGRAHRSQVHSSTNLHLAREFQVQAHARRRYHTNGKGN